MTETEDAERRYGVRCDLYIDGEISGTETVNERFFTLRETELVIERLCKIEGMPELSRPITAREYETAVQTAFDLEIKNIFLQERDSSGKSYIPKWDF